MIYIIDYDYVSESEFNDRLEEEINNYCEENYDNWLDDTYDPYKMGFCTYYPSDILKQCDPIAYRCGLSDYANIEYENATYDIERGREVCFNGCTFSIEEEE